MGEGWTLPGIYCEAGGKVADSLLILRCSMGAGTTEALPTGQGGLRVCPGAGSPASAEQLLHTPGEAKNNSSAFLAMVLQPLCRTNCLALLPHFGRVRVIFFVCVLLL